MSWGILPYIVGMAVGDFFWPSNKDEQKKAEDGHIEAKWVIDPFFASIFVFRPMEVKEEDLPEHLRVFDRY